ncbi:MAG: hypothetical protein JNL21_30660 [Myxococcales bacterium]|nr:hypothetical protein [Myxococcales bacterium]
MRWLEGIGAVMGFAAAFAGCTPIESESGEVEDPALDPAEVPIEKTGLLMTKAQLDASGIVFDDAGFGGMPEDWFVIVLSDRPMTCEAASVDTSCTGQRAWQLAFFIPPAQLHEGSIALTHPIAGAGWEIAPDCSGGTFSGALDSGTLDLDVTDAGLTVTLNGPSLSLAGESTYDGVYATTPCTESPIPGAPSFGSNWRPDF